MKLQSHTHFLPRSIMLLMITSPIIFQSKLKRPGVESLTLAHYMFLDIKRGPNSNVRALVFL